MEHTEHCKKRMKWGDGECECKHRVSASFSNDLLCDSWLIFYEDSSVDDEVFMGEGAESAAKERYRAALYNWNCHLFRKVMLVNT